SLFLLLLRRPPPSPRFPYTTLFRSDTLALVPSHCTPTWAGLDGSIFQQNGSIAADDIYASEVNDPALQLPGGACAGGRQCRYSEDRKSTRLNSSHVKISYAVFCLKK